MIKMIQCNSCGYDICGPEYYANMIDPFAHSGITGISSTAILEMSVRNHKDIICPNCNTVGNWMF